MQEKTVIICAGGIGKRMDSALPKQFLILSNKKSVLQTVIEKFYNYDKKSQIIVALPKDWIPFWKETCEKNKFIIPHEIVEGGKERYNSIKNALENSKGKFIAVHDAVRPIISKQFLTNCFNDIEIKKAIIPVLALKDSIRKISNDRSVALNRSNYVLVQTPQVFESKLLKEAYKQKFSKKITDDASLVEKLGVKVHFCNGDEKNIKITTPNDLSLVNFYLKNL